MVKGYGISSRTGIVGLITGAVCAAVCVFWITSSSLAATASSAGVHGGIGLVLSVASALAAGWLFLRYRSGIGRCRTTSRAEPSQAMSRQAAGPADSPSSAPPAQGDDWSAATRWLVRIGCVVSAVVLMALVIGEPVLVVNVVSLTMVAIAFTLILFLVPRGL